MDHLHYSVYNLYCDFDTAKDLWEALKKEYLTEEAGTKKYAIEQLLEYTGKMENLFWVKLENYKKKNPWGQIRGNASSEQFLVASTIYKLPPIGKIMGHP